jgi:hypothetical protein
LIYSFPAEQSGYRPIILPFLTLLVLGMTVSVVLWFLKKPLPALRSFAASALIAYLALIPLVSIYFKEANPIKEYCRKIENLYRPGDVVVKYKGFDDHFMMFYLDQKIITIDNESEMRKMLSGRARVLAVTEEPGKLKDLKIKVLSHKNNFVLFTN